MAIIVNHKQLTFTWSESGTQNVSADCDVTHEGWLKCMFVTMPSMCADVSADANLYDKAGHKVAQIGSDSFSAAGTTAVSGLDLPIESGSIMELKLSGIPGSAEGASATPLTGYVDVYLNIR